MVLVTKLMKAPTTIALTFALLTGVAFVGCGEADSGSATGAAADTTENADAGESAGSEGEAAGGDSDKKDDGSNRKEE